jgi:hypothetical protein
MTHMRFAVLAVYVFPLATALVSRSAFVPRCFPVNAGAASATRIRAARNDASSPRCDLVEAADDRFIDGQRDELRRDYSKRPEPTPTPCGDCMRIPEPTPPDSSDPRPKPKPTPIPQG